MTVAELIAKELGVKIGERFIFDEIEYILTKSEIKTTRTYFSWSFCEERVQAMINNKDKIVKINKLADSWDVNKGERCYYIDTEGKVYLSPLTQENIDCCNANKNKEYMQLIADKQNLFRKMLRFADCNNGKFEGKEMYYVYFDSDEQIWKIGLSLCYYEIMVVYFSRHSIAEKALEQFRDELESIRLAEIKIRG